ncbi:hypothetical protein BU23DRAFT_69318 [Bimuria novae-zelandiae CBS 107.79]|uniref:Uncharacterized protein n=1 Tax=Bimuria novae-zelandiae CBS 107.79 TaxID=1447943 RepID=A0A6A5VEE2_9PLEO|nr:hypothetical protein BU23DRAFT_69318 [Bimuria novae-zelandiae CBS 107.79]
MWPSICNAHGPRPGLFAAHIELQKATVARSCSGVTLSVLTIPTCNWIAYARRSLSPAPAPAIITYRFPANQRLRERSKQLARFIGGVFSRTLLSAPQLSTTSTLHCPPLPVAHGLFCAIPSRNPSPVVLSCAVRSISVALRSNVRSVTAPSPCPMRPAWPPCPASLRCPGSSSVCML